MKNFFLWVSIAAMAALFTMSASAADWNFYGSARVETFITDTDNKGTPDTKNFSQSLQTNSRIGANVKVNDELVGRFEYGASGGNANIRHLYGEWNFGAGNFLVGQTDTPLNMAFSNQVYGSDDNLEPYGQVDAGRRSMLRLSFGNFQIAAIRPDTTAFAAAGTTPEVKMPKIEASYRLDLDNAFLQFQGGYQTYELTDATTFITHDVNSYILAVGGQVTFGAVYLGGDLWVGQNTGAYGFNCAADTDPAVSGTTLTDNDSLGYVIVAGMKINDTFSFEAGYGYAEGELDQSGSNKDDLASYYIQSTVTLANGVFFVPEIGVVDNKKDNAGNDQSEIVYYGIKWQINF